MLKLLSLSRSQIQKRIDAALGRVPSDLLIREVTYLDVFSLKWRQGDVAIADGAIVGLEPGLKAARELDGKGKWLVPGFIDAHVHVESSLMIPSNFQRAVLPRGTTTAVCDPHEIANVSGPEGIEYFLDAATRLSLDLFVMLSSCVPATDFETNGAGTIEANQLTTMLFHAKALGLAEMMNVPGVLNGDPEVLRKLEAFSFGPMDGHSPLLRGKELSAYLTAGISSCHESSGLDEAREKISKGMSVWIREGSVAKDLHELVPALDAATSTTMGFCTDDRNPLDIIEEGHIDHLVRSAIKLGVTPEVAYRSASWSVARHYGLLRRGAIAPGHIADLVLLDDAASCAINSVIKGGCLASELELKDGPETSPANTIQAKAPELADLEGPKGPVHVITILPGKIITGRTVLPHDAPGVARLTVLERYGQGGKPSNAYVQGFGAKLRGAIASSVGHDSHNLIVVGSDPRDMRAALSALIECGGGFCVASGGEVRARLALPFAGLMCNEDPAKIAATLRELKQASRAIGCELPEPFLQLAFLSLPVIPSLKLTDKGLVDVDAFRIIDVRAS
ncbi:MAG: adenine deaminase [Oligoflexia bacterium]|nr:adenine deaminase [Oligoflexia bacterium]